MSWRVDQGDSESQNFCDFDSNKYIFAYLD